VYPNLTPTLVGLLAAALLVTGAIALRGPLVRRLALRQLNRRRGEAALVVTGSVLGTAIIIGSFIVGDTLNFSVKRNAYDHLGVIDEVVSSSTPAQGEEAARRLAALAGDPDVDGLLTVRRHRAAVAKGDGQAAAGRKSEPRATVVEVDFAAAARFEGAGARLAEREAGGLAGPAPGPGEMVLNDELAGSLGAAAGDRVTVYLNGRPAELRVARVVPTRGLAGYAHGFLAPGTLDRAAGAGAGASAEPEVQTLVSNTGGVEGGNAASDRVAGKLTAALGPLTQRGTTVDKPKQEVLEEARVAGDSLGSLFLFVGSFAIIAGVLLLVNVFVMLAEERKPELGMLRAVGMRRGRLVRGFVIEGAVYALVAAAVGVAAGLAVGRAVVEVAARIFASFSPDEGGLDLVFKVTPTSLVNGFALGFLIAFVTVALTSIRISRVNIIAAIRDLPGEGGRRLKRRWVALSTLAAAGAGAAAAVAIADSQGVGTYLYPAVAVLALCPLLVRVLPRRAVYSGASLVVLGWGLAASTVRPKVFDDGSTATFIVLGVVLTFSAVLLVSQNQELLLRPLRPLLRRPSDSGLATRLAVAYPVARRFRTGAILIMYGLVVFTLVLITVLGNVIGSSVDRAVADASGGYALRVDYNPSAPVADPARRFTEGRFAGRVREVAPLSAGEARVTGLPGLVKPIDTTVVGATPALAEHGRFRLAARLDRLGDDHAVWRTVMADPRYVLVDQYLGETGAGPTAITYGPGDVMTITDPSTGATRRKTIAGILADDTAFDGIGEHSFGSPVIMAAGGLREQFGAGAKATSALLGTAPGVSDEALAADLQGEFLPHGLVTTRIRHMVEVGYAANRSFFQLMQGFLALGLVVGVAGLGVVMVRAVRERRRTVGVLRALGFPARVVRRAFLVESSFVALEGILLGTALSIVTAYLLFRNDDELQAAGGSFPVPWLAITVLVAATAVASLAATAWPARQAARIHPAVALRIAD
jgi:putative ABC transport system permease protein